MPSYNAQQIDYCTRQVSRFIAAVDYRAVQQIQASFLNQRRRASMYIWSSVAVILALNFCLFIDRMFMLAIILTLAVVCWKNYCSLCKCPSCSVSLLSSNQLWRLNANRFSTTVCPRCQIQLIESRTYERLSDAQSLKLHKSRLNRSA